MPAAGPIKMTNSEERHRRALRVWLWSVAALVFAMVVVGGTTRLTDSGLSIVEWKPVTGAIPPLSETEWQVEFDKYKTIPQYEVLNKGMGLRAFKVIYWWEWSHRQLGRLIGLAFALPLALFWWRGWLAPQLKPKLVALLALGGGEGALGWWMVFSGLSVRTDVSQIRLALHVTLAAIILVAIVWVAQSLAPPRQRAPVRQASRRLGYALLPLVLAQIFLGGLVAGLNAGLSHNTWPLMDGRLVPPLADLYVMSPAWLNHFDNAMTVQFQHRLLAYLIVVLALWHAVVLRRANAGGAARRAMAVAVTALAQAAIGIMALLLIVPLWAALLHQAVAILLLVMVTIHAEALARDAAATPGERRGYAAASA
jgi:cytochrome c oxidase assembly protein subunit 15